MMVRRFHLWCLALFCVAYSGFLLYHWSTDARRSLQAPSTAKPAGGVTNDSRLAKAGPGQLTRDRPIATLTKSSTARQPELIAEVSSQTEDSEAEVDLGEQAIRASEPQERASAIDGLSAATTPEALQALQIAATSDATVRNRIRAVNSLRVLAGRGETKDEILTILQRIMSDSNPSVASRAAAAYREITEPVAEETAATE